MDGTNVWVDVKYSLYTVCVHHKTQHKAMADSINYAQILCL